MATTLYGLPAQVDEACRVLVLGSMPGAASLAQARYYAHPRNRFWPLMARLLGIEAALDYPRRIAALNGAGVGLWDVIGQCTRTGSLDAAIAPGSIVANPLPELLPRLPRLAAIACNGGTAVQAWRRHVVARLDARAAALPVYALPSTSPANAGRSLQALEQAWRVLLPHLS
ncbi:MAG TPA: DNA-deoxyinosine glycosylase [Xanthomonadaceae bacterium]|nr:DNA-deoxyinosine glycosylase [Xanthomonadaceae bacterium]